MRFTDLVVKYYLEAMFIQILQYERIQFTRQWFKALHQINLSLQTWSKTIKDPSSLHVRPSRSSFPWLHILSTIAWPQLTMEYTLTPIFKSARGKKLWRTNLGSIPLESTWKRSRQNYKMMQRKDIISTGVLFRVLERRFINWTVWCEPSHEVRECCWPHEIGHGWLEQWYIIWIISHVKFWKLGHWFFRIRL